MAEFSAVFHKNILKENLMEKKGFIHSLPFKLLVALALGICFGLLLNSMDQSATGQALLNIVVTVKFIVGQFISF